MRKISADYIFPVSSPPIKNGVVTVDEKGIILEVAADSGNRTGEVERYKGIITPGFINTHCHLELSHLKGQLSEGNGLTGFISELIPKREQYSADQIKSALVSAEDEMIRNGIVAVADISNTDHTFEQKKKQRLIYHTFLEIFDLASENANQKLSDARSMIAKHSSLDFSITPHAPYSVSGKLMDLIDGLKQPFLSMHNQESSSENELFASGTGFLAELMKRAGVDIETLKRDKRSLLFTFGHLIETNKILLVHNTYSSKEDIELLKQYSLAAESDIFLCLCPRANLYIEKRLPDIPMFFENKMKMTIGTDSYASNWSLSVLEEMKAIANSFPKIPFEAILAWTTKNGAEFLGKEKEFGTIQIGKKPGLNLLKGISDGFELSEKVSVQRLI